MMSLVHGSVKPHAPGAWGAPGPSHALEAASAPGLLTPPEVPAPVQETGWTTRQVRAALREAHLEDRSFDDGEVLGSMCTAPHFIAQEAYALFLETNLGDPGHFPGAARLEQEALDDLKTLLHAPRKAGARILTGGTEANLLAMYAAREKTGRRTVVLPDSAHFSFEKAARLLGMRLKHVPTTPDGHADVAAMEKAVGKDTALAVGVAGTTELGLVDPIEALARMARRKQVPLHVDAAFGGYLLPFLEDASRTPRRFDFSLPGVWSLSIDPHKMGMAPIPAGVLVLRDDGDWGPLAVETPYVSTDRQATLMGTRPGAAAAAVWAVHRLLGRAGYASLVETCLDNAAYLAARLEEAGVELVAPPELNVVTFRAADPVALAKALDEAGYRVNVVPRFSAIRIVVNPHVTRRHVEGFLRALQAVTA